ncbi:MAG TPA: integrase arm-type DNA-binding domain-containing protein, partial [Nevskiaceae bacterium]
MLNVAQVRSASAKERAYKLYDGHGLFLLVTPTGGRLWRWKYHRPGSKKENLLSLGTYPLVSLQRARQKRDEVRRQLDAGLDPGMERRAQSTAAGNTFEAVMREWYKKHKGSWSESYKEHVLQRLEANVLPWMGNRPIAGIKAPEVLACLRRVEERGAVDTARRIRQYCSQVFRYAVAKGMAEYDPTTSLRGALAAVKKKHYASIRNPQEIGALLRALDGYSGTFVTRCALRLAPLVFVRPGELRRAEWSEFDVTAAQWCIPPEKMKMDKDHIVPLSRQALAIIKELRPLTGS